MSMIIDKTIKCNNCGREGEFKMWSSINVSLNPKMKEDLLNGEVFKFKCPHCGDVQYISYPILYHDMEKKIMIQDLCVEEDDGPIGENMIAGLMGSVIPGMEDEYIIRYVGHANELMEKVQIFDNDYDDRIIEIDKLFCAMHFSDEEPEADRIRVYYQAEGEGSYALINEEGVLAITPFDKERYDSLVEEYKDILPDIRSEECAVVNANWAMDFLLSLHENQEELD